MNVELWAIQPDDQVDRAFLVERAARVCYRSSTAETKEQQRRFLVSLSDRGHLSIFEHARYLRVNHHRDPYRFLWNTRYGTAVTEREHCFIVSLNARNWMELHGINPVLDSIARNYIGYGELSNPEKLAHASATFCISGISRACSHQLVRHRVMSFCLSGETVVVAYAKRGNSAKRWTLEQLWSWSNDVKRKGRLKLIRLRGINGDNEIIPVAINKVLSTGKQEVFLLKTSSGRSVKATKRHRFLTVDGWSELSSLSVGDTIYANGTPAYKDPDYIRRRYIGENMQRKDLAAHLGIADSTLGKWIRKFGLQKPRSKYPNRKPGHGVKDMFSDEQRAEISKRMSGPNNHRWLGDKAGVHAGNLRAIKMYEADCCRRCNSTRNLVRHHVDGNTHNNSSDNIEILCEPCHKAIHFGQAVSTVFRDEIVSIESIGVERTYDLEIEHDCHCYVANGLIVHNSQESQRYCDTGEWEAVVPPAIEDFVTLRHFDLSVQDAKNTYSVLRERGIAKQDARFVLPNATPTKIVVTATFKHWLRFLKLRCDKAAQWEIRGVADEILRQLHEVEPGLFLTGPEA